MEWSRAISGRVCGPEARRNTGEYLLLLSSQGGRLLNKSRTAICSGTLRSLLAGKAGDLSKTADQNCTWKKVVFIHFVKTKYLQSSPALALKAVVLRALVPQNSNKRCWWQEWPCLGTVFVYILSDPVFCISLSA